MKNIQKGFTLIELMIVIAIIAILAAIAIPAYQDYTIRSKVSELVVAADACKTSVAEYYQSQGTLPTNGSSAGCSDNTTQYIAGLTVANGVVTVAADNSGGRHLPSTAGGNFVLTPTPAGADKPLSWACNTAATTIAKKYLPASCR